MGVPPGLSSPSGASLRASSNRSSLSADGYFDAPEQSSNGLSLGGIYPHRTRGPFDPRTSSTQSLAPSLGADEQRRTLLIIYIHGFMGNDTSFRSFPAHVHQFLKESLAETHVIHTKIYPRYKTYKSIEVARDNFSVWLEPHESPTTDVVLIGHSMGGLLAADVALSTRAGTNGMPSLRHRILGTVSLDAPLLGLHPGIVVSGIASLFRPAATPTGQTSSGSVNAGSEQSLSLSPDPSIYSEVAPPSEAYSPALTQTSSYQSQSPSAPDPYYNPSFFNDASFVDRGWFRNIAHFAKKHRQENLVEAAANHIMSHLEFGGCLADYPGMRARYNRLRQLEDADDLVPAANGERAVRVRFVNYYTVSTGPIKKPKSELPTALLKPDDAGQQTPQRKSLDITSRPSTPSMSAGTSTPRISIEDHSDSGRPMMLQEIDPIPEPDDLTLDEPTPTNHDDHSPSPPPPKHVYNPTDQNTTPETEPPSTESLPLPPIPSLPPAPPPFDPSLYTDKDSRKQAEKESKRTQKTYDQAVKSRDKAIKEREKLVEKRRRKSLKDAEKLAKMEQKALQQREKERQGSGKVVEGEGGEEKEEKGDGAAATREKEEEGDKTSEKGRREAGRKEQEVYTALEKSRQKDEEKEKKSQQELDEKKQKEKEKKEKKKKLGKFCMLPGKINGLQPHDPTWIQVYMEGVDEVGAHCGLFFPGPHYEKLVGDVGERIVGWVLEDLSRRAIFELD